DPSTPRPSGVPLRMTRGDGACDRTSVLAPCSLDRRAAPSDGRIAHGGPATGALGHRQAPASNGRKPSCHGPCPRLMADPGVVNDVGKGQVLIFGCPLDDTGRSPEKAIEPIASY